MPQLDTANLLSVQPLYPHQQQASWRRPQQPLLTLWSPSKSILMGRTNVWRCLFVISVPALSQPRYVINVDNTHLLLHRFILPYWRRLYLHNTDIVSDSSELNFFYHPLPKCSSSDTLTVQLPLLLSIQIILRSTSNSIELPKPS